MWCRALAGIWMLWIVWASPGVIHAATDDVPQSPSPHYVLDEPGWLGAAGFQRLDARLAAYEQETSSQLLVAVFKRLPQDAELFDFCQRVFDQWQPGGKDKDNGVILFAFSEDRKLRIHTGYGMEGALPDALCIQIISNDIAPLLREGRREDALTAGVEAIIAATKGEYQASASHDRMNWLPVVFLVVFLVILISQIRARQLGAKDVILSRGGRSYQDWGGGGWGGGAWGGGGWGGGGGGFSGGGGMSGGGGASGGW